MQQRSDLYVGLMVVMVMGYEDREEEERRKLKKTGDIYPKKNTNKYEQLHMSER